MDPRAEKIAELLAVVDRLRAPDGCPWDREQTVESMAPCVVEEAHELAEAVDRKAVDDVREEAGDVLMALSLLCRIASEDGRFDLGEAARVTREKIVRRHPHVFGPPEARADSAAAALESWEAVKRRERREKEDDASALDGVPRTLPALQRAGRLCAKAVAAGFRWPSAAGALDKLREEMRELEEALDGGGEDEARRRRVEEELGDVLLAGAFLARYLDVEPEQACRMALLRFERRFRHMERSLGGELGDHDLAVLMRVWEEAKAGE